MKGPRDHLLLEKKCDPNTPHALNEHLNPNLGIGSIFVAPVSVKKIYNAELLTSGCKQGTLLLETNPT